MVIRKKTWERKKIVTDGTLRPCQDYHYLNSHTVRNTYPLLLIPELINDMKESTLLTKFDIHWGYNNIRIQEEDQWKAAFITPLGLFKPTVMFFRFCNAPPTFQAFMNHIFANMLRKKWLKIYMDDLGIHTKDDIALHHDRTRQVLQWLREYGLSIKLSKCIFDAPHMEFLGMIIGQGEIKMDEKKLGAIKEWKPPTSVKGIQSFTRFANFYRKFISDFSNIVTPLNLTRKGEPWIWTRLQQDAFKHLKCIFSSAPVLWILDVTHPFSIMTNTSLLAAGAVLMQADKNCDLHPCAYFSCTFSSAPCNYDIYDHKLLAVILVLEEWHQYLQGTAHLVTIITDHKNLSDVKDLQKLSRQQARWLLFLQDFDLLWQVTPGAKMAPTSVSKSSWQLVQRLATGLDHNWLQLDCSCQLPSLPKIKKTSCGLVATGLFEDRSLGPWSPHSGAYTLFFHIFIYLFEFTRVLSIMITPKMTYNAKSIISWASVDQILWSLGQ